MTEPTRPYILENYSLLAFLQHTVESRNNPSWLIVCSTREHFESRLTQELMQDETPGCEAQSFHAEQYFRRCLSSRLTLRLLASCSALKIVFTPDVACLRAFLASLTLQHPSTRAAGGTIAVLDPVEVHRSSTAFSAQGLNRTLALAVEAASTLRSALTMCESLPVLTESAQDHNTAAINDDHDSAEASLASPWDQTIGIVDVHTKTFGPGSRGWVGRTIKIRQVAERWFTFKQAVP